MKRKILRWGKGIVSPNAIHQITSCGAYDILKEKKKSVKKFGPGVVKHNSNKAADEDTRKRWIYNWFDDHIIRYNQVKQQTRKS